MIKREIKENNDTFEDRLSIAAYVRNEAPYLKEWIEYHKLAGVSKFYIYDNYSNDAIQKVLCPYIESGIVVYTLFPPQKEARGRAIQIAAYNDAIIKYRNKTEWLAIIDVDEFIVPLTKNTIVDEIDNIARAFSNKIPAVGVYWVLYGFSGHYSKPKGLVIENYTRSRVKEKVGPYPDSYFWIKEERIKSIINPRMTLSYCIHGGKYLLKQYGIDENGRKIDSEKGFVPQDRAACIERIRINHYWTKSYEEFLEKLSRQKVHSFEKYIKIDYDPFFLSNKKDYIMKKYVSKLKKIINEGQDTI